MALQHKGMVALVGALGFVVLGSPGIAQDKAAIVKDRQAYMKNQGADTKTIGDYAKGMADKASAIKAIDDLLARNPKMLALFAPGTSTTDMPGVSYAKPAIWTDKDHFAMTISTLHDLEVKEAALIKTGTPAEVGAGLADLGKNGCGGCHAAFREKKPE
jgi:cytochrome c556